MKKIIQYWLLTSILYGLNLAAKGIDEFYFTHRSSWDMVGFDKAEDVATGKTSLRIREYNSKCKVIFLDPKDNFITTKHKKVPHWMGKYKVGFVKAKVLECPTNRYHVGKELFVAAGSFDSNQENKILWDQAEYDKRLKIVFAELSLAKDKMALKQLADDFKHHAIAEPARVEYLKLVDEENRLKAAITKERQQLISEIESLYQASFAKLSLMQELSRKWMARADYKKSSYPEVKPIIYTDAISEAQHESLISKIYQKVSKENSIVSLREFISTYPTHTLAKKAAADVLALITPQQNIAAYQWFIETYPEYNQSAKKALSQLHRFAFEQTQDEGTLAAYNDFIIAYPYAQQVEQAKQISYELEDDHYSSWFSSDEKQSRALLVKSKQLERKMNDQSSGMRDGYRLVIDRMNELLQNKFPAEEATLRYLESEEFKDFYRNLKSSLRNIERALVSIKDNTSGLKSLLKSQSSMMNNHFEKAAESKALSDKYTEQHRYWQRYLKTQGS